MLASNIEQAAKWFAETLQLLQFQLSSSIQKKFPVASIFPRLDGRSQPDESRGFVYSKPLLFNPADIITEEDIMSYTAVITFNLGLAHQLEGQALCDGGRFLHAAMELYEVTLHQLNNQVRYDCSNVIIASLNNLACLNAELFLFERGHQMLLFLAVLIKEGRVRTDTIHADDFSDIVLNIRLLSMPICAGKA